MTPEHLESTVIAVRGCRATARVTQSGSDCTSRNRATLRTANQTVGLLAMASIAVALVVMAVKYLAYVVTGSVALYSDALESVVNVITAIAALVAVRIAQRPADRRHPFGHHKAEYVAVALEGALIVIAALMILQQAYLAWRMPRALEAPVLGLMINAVATAMNAGWAYVLIARGRHLRSPALTADGWHLVTDVVTSLGVLAGLILATLTGWAILDPLLGAMVAINILWAGWRITSSSVSGLMDESATAEIMADIRLAIAGNADGALQVHDLRTRTAGPATFVEFHLVVPGAMTVARAHDICDRIEAALHERIQDAQILIHVEPEEEAKTKGAMVI
jgi:cation diffusion facilitator family transporter